VKPSQVKEKVMSRFVLAMAVVGAASFLMVDSANAGWRCRGGQSAYYYNYNSNAPAMTSAAPAPAPVVAGTNGQTYRSFSVDGGATPVQAAPSYYGPSYSTPSYSNLGDSAVYRADRKVRGIYTYSAR
jgi:hypothetical protein